MPQLRDPELAQYCIALYDNIAESFDELSFKTGEILLIIEEDPLLHDGWIICSLKGKRGICPRNRLRILNEHEQSIIRDCKKNIKLEHDFHYDMPQPTTFQENLQYDVPQSNQSQSTGESYDVPKLVSGSLTPSSSVSSLTTDSNRSSLVQQDYDVPKSVKLHISQGLYDIPKNSTEVILDITSALEWLGRLESDLTSGISGLVSVATLGWRSRSNLEPRLVELRWSVSRLSVSLHDLTIFCQSIRAIHQDKIFGNKLGPFVANLTKSDVLVKECCQDLEQIGWNAALLAVEDPDLHEPDALDTLVSCAAALTDDVRQVTSFIQGNATLLFKKNLPVGNESFYINLENTEKEENVLNKDEQETCKNQIKTVSQNDKKLLDFYSNIIIQHISSLMQEINLLLSTITQNRPPKAFLLQAKCVVTSCQRVLQLSDTVSRSIITQTFKRDLESIIQKLNDSMITVGQKTRTAAVHFPSVSAVQYMVDSAFDLANSASRLKQAILVH